MKQSIKRYLYHISLSFLGLIGVSAFLSPVVTVILVVATVGLMIYHYREMTQHTQQISQALATKTDNLASLRESLLEAERDKQEYEAFFDAFVGATLYIEDVKQQQFYYSLGVEGLFGYTQAQFNQDGRLWHQLVTEEDLADVVEHHQLLFQGVSVDHTFRIIHPTEGEKWIQKIAKPIANELGSIVKIYGKFIDVTAQKTLEQQLRKMAYFDDLTDLPNRKMLDRHIKKHSHALSVTVIHLR